jgi:hypothetical protein
MLSCLSHGATRRAIVISTRPGVVPTSAAGSETMIQRSSAPTRFQGLQRRDLVYTHQAGVTRDIRRKYSCETTRRHSGIPAIRNASAYR